MNSNSNSRLTLIAAVLLFHGLILGKTDYLKNFHPDSLRLKKVDAQRCDEAPIIDGYITDSCWETTRPVDEFFQNEPKELSVPSENTVARVCFDNEALYIFIEAFDSQPENIKKTLVRRDRWMDGFANNSDWVGVTIDSKNDDYNGYFFAVNASGVIMDVALSGEWDYDPTWNPVWDVDIAFNDSGWTAEFKLPFAVFQFENKPDMEWGIEFERSIHRLQERVGWPGRSKSIRGLILPLGVLSGINNIPTPKQLEVIPYGLTGYSDKTHGNIGLDMRYGLTSNSMMKLTFNPDFGQVEADPSVLNLTAFETFYEEKRPFFSEGSEFFSHRISLFNSRRIGRRPNYNIPDDGELEGIPEYTTILGASRIMGSTSSGINYGFIGALTAEESATHVDSLGNRKKIVVEPMTNYSIGRIEVPMINKVSRFGIMTTNVSRKNNPGANVVGTDWALGFYDNRLYTSGQLIQSNTNDIIGNAYIFRFGYLDPKWWSIRFWHGNSNEKFDINDLGYIRRSGNSYVGGRLELRKQEPWGRFINNNLELKVDQGWNQDGLVIARGIDIEQDNLFSNYWSMGLFGKIFLPAYEDGDIFRNDNAWAYKTELWGYAGPRFTTDRRKKVVIESSIGLGYGKNRGHGYRASLELEMKPIEPLNIEIEAMQDRSPNYMQWVDILENIDDTVRVYANSVLLTRDITLRLDWTFSPQMSLQCFVQPFYANMDYERFYRLLAPKTMDLQEYDYLQEHEDPDFKLYNTVGTFVFRWEYRSGSTLFLVYNLNQSRYYSPSENEWSYENENALYFKINYWFKN